MSFLVLLSGGSETIPPALRFDSRPSLSQKADLGPDVNGSALRCPAGFSLRRSSPPGFPNFPIELNPNAEPSSSPSPRFSLALSYFPIYPPSLSSKKSPCCVAPSLSRRRSPFQKSLFPYLEFTVWQRNPTRALHSKKATFADRCRRRRFLPLERITLFKAAGGPPLFRTGCGQVPASAFRPSELL